MAIPWENIGHWEYIESNQTFPNKHSKSCQPFPNLWQNTKSNIAPRPLITGLPPRVSRAGAALSPFSEFWYGTFCVGISLAGRSTARSRGKRPFRSPILPTLPFKAAQTTDAAAEGGQSRARRRPGPRALRGRPAAPRPNQRRRRLRALCFHRRRRRRCQSQFPSAIRWTDGPRSVIGPSPHT